MSSTRANRYIAGEGKKMYDILSKYDAGGKLTTNQRWCDTDQKISYDTPGITRIRVCTDVKNMRNYHSTTEARLKEFVIQGRTCSNAYKHISTLSCHSFFFLQAHPSVDLIQFHTKIQSLWNAAAPVTSSVSQSVWIFMHWLLHFTRSNHGTKVEHVSPEIARRTTTYMYKIATIIRVASCSCSSFSSYREDVTIDRQGLQFFRSITCYP